MAQPLVLCFNFSAERLAKVRATCFRYHLKMIEGDTKDANQPVGALLGVTNRREVEEARPFPGELMILHGFSQFQYDTLMNDWRSMGCTPVRLKCETTQAMLLQPVIAVRENLVRLDPGMNPQGVKPAAEIG